MMCTYRILSTSNRSPIHLWNAVDGQLEATYRVYDQYVFLILCVFIIFLHVFLTVYSIFILY